VAVFPGPACLGRGAVISPGQEVPAELRAHPRVRVDAALLADPEASLDTAAQLRQRWAHREPTVVELAVEPQALKQPEREERAPWELGSAFAFPLEQLRFLVWANSYDLRGGTPVWWHGVLAERAGAGPSAVGDVHLAEHGDVLVDGGPRGPVPGCPLPLVHAESVADRRLTVARAEAPVEDLAADQLAAVDHGAGSARVIAPAGSGKTRVLVARLRHLVEGRNVDADQITAVAYNTRAAAQMRERIGRVGARVKTLHALGWEIVRAAHPTLRLVQEPEVRQVLERIAPVRPAPNTDVLAPYLQGFERVRLGLVPPAQVAATTPDAPELARVYERWRAWMHANDALDFDEQIHGAVLVLLRDAALRRAFQRSCRLLLVDEFQDLSPAFLLLVRLLAAPAWQVFGVGDDDQTIYGYRRADPAHLVDFARWFPEPSAYALQTNYRCPADVVEAAGHLLARNTVRVPKTIAAAPDAPRRGMTIRRIPGEELARAAVDWVAAALEGGAAPAEVAVLARVHSMLLPVQVGLLVAGIPARSEVGVTMFERTGARAALAWLRLATGERDRLDGADLAEALRRSPHRLRGDTLRALAARSTWSRAEVRNHAYDVLAMWEGQELRGALDDLDLVRTAARSEGTIGALQEVKEILAEALDDLDTSTTASKQTSSHLDDVDALIQVAGLQPDAARFEPWLRELLAAGRTGAADADTVTLATVHATKGLEWPQVLVYAANAGLMPHRLAAGQAALEEERRVFHVAITRTSQEVLVLAAQEFPSPYLGELAGPPPAPTPKRASPRPGRGRGAAAPSRGSGADAVVPRTGQRLQVAGGMVGTVENVDETGVLLRTGSGALVRARYGERVEHDGSSGVLRKQES
jgi:DNA helicase II / ATP-dependent DNA helicase PcrA